MIHVMDVLFGSAGIAVTSFLFTSQEVVTLSVDQCPRAPPENSSSHN